MNKVPKLKGTERGQANCKRNVPITIRTSVAEKAHTCTYISRRFSLMINIRGTSGTLLAFLSIHTPHLRLKSTRKASFEEIDKFSDNIKLIKTYKSNFFLRYFAVLAEKHKIFADLLGKTSPNEAIRGVPEAIDFHVVRIKFEFLLECQFKFSIEVTRFCFHNPSA